MSTIVARSDDSHRSPANQPTAGRYRLRLARTRGEIEAALRLRFEVFNLELHEGFAESFFTGMDEDEFDRICDHLLVTEELTGRVVGTYRLQSGKIAARSEFGRPNFEQLELATDPASLRRDYGRSAS
jgi:putative hemolysin